MPGGRSNAMLQADTLMLPLGVRVGVAAAATGKPASIGAKQAQKPRRLDDTCARETGLWVSVACVLV